jgi:hypothetical protein
LYCVKDFVTKDATKDSSDTSGRAAIQTNECNDENAAYSSQSMQSAEVNDF